MKLVTLQNPGEGAWGLLSGLIMQVLYPLGESPSYTCPHFAPSWKLPSHDSPAIKSLLLKLTDLV